MFLLQLDGSFFCRCFIGLKEIISSHDHIRCIRFSCAHLSPLDSSLFSVATQNSLANFFCSFRSPTKVSPLLALALTHATFSTLLLLGSCCAPLRGYVLLSLCFQGFPNEQRVSNVDPGQIFQRRPRAAASTWGWRCRCRCCSRSCWRVSDRQMHWWCCLKKCPRSSLWFLFSNHFPSSLLDLDPLSSSGPSAPSAGTTSWGGQFLLTS